MIKTLKDKDQSNCLPQNARRVIVPTNDYENKLKMITIIDAIESTLSDEDYAKNTNVENFCYLINFYNLVKQAIYWVGFRIVDNYRERIIYFINLHPQPIHRYASFKIKKSGGYKCDFTFSLGYLELPFTMNPDKEIIPDINWFLRNYKQEYEIFEESELSKQIHAGFIKNNTDVYEIEWVRYHLMFHIPRDVQIPTSSHYDKNPIDTIVGGYLHNLEFGYKDGLVDESDHEQYLYWFPFMYDYDFLMRIYLINLHPEATDKFAVFSKYRETDYSSASGSTFRIINNYGKLNKEIPDTDELIHVTTDSSDSSDSSDSKRNKIPPCAPSRKR
jgi:hypothetical protein